MRARGKRVCAEAVAGGGVTLRLRPGDYSIVAELVGGGTVHASYHLRDGHPAPPLVLRSRAARK